MRHLLGAMMTLAVAASPAAAQCADGSPPPCRVQTVAIATRRADPPLDAKAWIVVPFDNLNGNQEVDWLRTGSVNLLYLGMSRWTDIRVIDDERVADYMREVPGATDAKSVSASMGLAIARRAGAGHLVMGDLLKLGSRTTVNAKIYDVRTGQRLRTVREETVIADSIMALFAKLSQKVLNIAPPAGSSDGIVGTNNIAAYQAYAQGMQAMNGFEMSAARALFARALELDSTFALAHAKLSVLVGWISPNDPAGRAHAEAAARLSGSLPPRERALIAANVAFARREYVTACDGFRAIVRKDSTDTDAWYGLGDCLFHDPGMVPIGGDSARPRFRGDRNESVRAFKTALALDPTYHLAYQHMVEAYQQQFVAGQWCTGGSCAQHVAVVRPSGDSLLVIPLRLPRDSATFRQHTQDYIRLGARRQLFERGDSIARVWALANPTETRAQLMHGLTQLSVGNVTGADDSFRRVPADTSFSGINLLFGRLEAALKLGQGARLNELYDSVRAHSVRIAGTPPNVIMTGSLAALVSPTLGRFAHYDSLIGAGMRQSGASPASTRERLARAVMRTLAGIASDSLVVIGAALYNEVQAQSPAAATRGLAPLLGWVVRQPTAGWPPLDTTVRDLRSAPAIAALRQDSAAMRRAARSLDSLSSVYRANLVPDTGAALAAAEAYLAVRDSALALQMTRRWLDSIAPFTPAIAGQAQGTLVQPLLSRAMVQRADLAAALGRPDEARVWYDRALSFWSAVDADVQPLVDRVRKSRAALSP